MKRVTDQTRAAEELLPYEEAVHRQKSRQGLKLGGER